MATGPERGGTPMGLGTITLLGMLCTPGQVPADITTWNSPSMKIPIDYHPGKRGEIKELLLYVSADQGQTWHQHAVGMPDRDSHFNYNAPADGVYWFNMVVVDKSGRRDPADIFKAGPALKVLFDTKKPVVSIASAQRAGDDVTVSWKITEKNPDWSKFKVEYSTNGTNWVPVSTRPEADGSAQFKAPAGGSLSVRVAMADVAGHMGEASTPVAGTTTAVVTKPMESPVIPTGGTADPPSSPVIGSTGAATGVVMPATPPIALSERASETRFPHEPKGMDTIPAPAFPPAPGTPGGPPITTPSDPAPPTPGMTPPADPVGISTPSTAHLPAPQVINVTTFKMAYEVEDKGASGVAKADVWVTRNDGRTWGKWTSFEKPESPLVIELAKNGPKDVEGVYGFRVVLHSGAGLSREAPKNGEAPDLRVDVDVTAPVVHVYAPVPDPAHKDTLVLRWTAADRNLASDPITLEWSEGAKGPWLPIAATDGIVAGSGIAKRLPNTGTYGWKLPSNFPTHKVYLKVTARDVGGNVAEAISGEPVLVDLNKPAAVKLNIVGGR